MNETNLAQHFTSDFLIQFVYQEKAFLFAAFHMYRCHVDVWSVYYV